MQVIFDVGGVLLDWNPERYLTECFPALDAQTIAAQTFRSSTWQALDAGRIERAAVQQAFVESTGLDPDTVEALLDGMPASLLTVPRIAQLAEDLSQRGTPVFVLSNMPRYVAAALDARQALPTVFTERVFSYAEQALKPFPEIYHALLDRCRLDAQECVFIDDSRPNLDSAVALGMQVVHMPDVSEATANAVADQVLALL